MARSEIPVVEIMRESGVPAVQVLSDAVNKHFFNGNAGKTFLEIESTDAGTQYVLVQPSPDLYSDGLNIDPLQIDVGPGTTVKRGPFRMKTFNQDKLTGEVWVDPSVSGTLKIRAFSLEPAT